MTAELAGVTVQLEVDTGAGCSILSLRIIIIPCGENLSALNYYLLLNNCECGEEPIEHYWSDKSSYDFEK